MTRGDSTIDERVPRQKRPRAGVPVEWTPALGAGVRSAVVIDRSLGVVRLCSVFEPPDGLTAPATFDPVGGMQAHTGELSRALDRRGVRQVVVTSRPPGAPLTAALRRVLADDALARSLAERGRDCSRAYSWPGLADRVLDVYTAVAAGRVAA